MNEKIGVVGRETELRLIQMGNAMGIRIPGALIDKYGLREEVVLEEREEGLLIHSRHDTKLSWEETYKQMAADEAAEREDWSDWHSFQDEDQL